MSIARKELKRTFKNGIEVVTNERVDFEFDKDVEEALCEVFDDLEYGNDHGVYQSDDGIFSIDVDACIEELQDRIDSDPEDTFQEKTGGNIKFRLDRAL